MHILIKLLISIIDSSKKSGKVTNLVSCLSSPSGNWNVTQDTSDFLVKSKRCKKRIDFNSIVNTHPSTFKFKYMNIGNFVYC